MKKIRIKNSRPEAVWEIGFLNHFQKLPEKHLQRSLVNTTFLEALWMLFIDRVQLPQGSSATTMTAQKTTFSIKDFFSKCDQIRNFLRI